METFNCILFKAVVLEPLNIKFLQYQSCILYRMIKFLVCTTGKKCHISRPKISMECIGNVSDVFTIQNLEQISILQLMSHFLMSVTFPNTCKLEMSWIFSLPSNWHGVRFPYYSCRWYFLGQQRMPHGMRYISYTFDIPC